MKVGLVLEGGAMRGMYTAGVLDTFLDHNIEFKEIIGVSAGALFGINYVSKQKERTIRYNKKYNHDKDYIGLLPLIKEGNIVNTQKAYHDIPYELDPFDNETFMNSNTHFYSVVTNIETGKSEYILIEDAFKQIDYLRASGSMPFVSQIVELDQKKYLDGGIADSIPYQYLLDHGCDKVVVILTRDIHYIKKPMNTTINHNFYKNYPELVKALDHRHEMYTNTLTNLYRLQAQGKAFIIQPTHALEIGRIETDPDVLQSVYDLGINDATHLLDDLKEFIQ